MTKEQLQNVRVVCDVLGEGGKVGTRAVHQLLDWIDELERHAEADAANAKHMRSQLAESQAREALLAKRLGPAGAEMLRDLVGVIKTLSAAAEALCGRWLDDSDQVMPEAFIARSNMRKVLASTLEIRERIGAV